MKRRIVALLLMMVMIFTMITACGSTPSNDNPNNNVVEGGNETVVATGNFTVPEGGYDGSEVTITFYNTMGANLKAVLETYIVEFNKLYPNITVVSTNVGNYDDCRDQISTEITVGNQPNLAYCYPDHVALYNLAKVVTTLDDLIASQETVTRADGTTEILGLTDAQIAEETEQVLYQVLHPHTTMARCP